jgi:putative copper resistance protein D
MSFGQAFHDWMSDGAVAWLGLVLSLATGALYVTAAARRSPRGHRWPVRRTTAFLAGLLVTAVALDSGVAAHDDVPSVHMFQHALLMMLAPLLLALGAPVTLALRTLRGDGRGRLLAVLHDPAVRRVTSRPVALIADYNVTMAIVLVAPVYRLAEQYLALHIAIHVYLIVCGLFFWTVVLARDPVPARLAAGRRVTAALACIPLNLLLAAALVARPGWFVDGSVHEAQAAAVILMLATTATSLAGIRVISSERSRRRPAPDSTERRLGLAAAA